jgi:hypothetical protein
MRPALYRRSGFLPPEVWVVAFPPDDGPEAVVSALMRGVVARLAEDDAVVHGVRSSELDVPNVMGLHTLAKFVIRSACVPKSGDVRSTAGTAKSLTRKGALLSRS